MDEDPKQPPYNEFSDEDIKNILKDALSMRIKEKRAIPKRNELNNALVSTLSEFMTCFKIMGYDLDGNPINLTYYKEKMERDALNNSFMEEIGKFMSGRVG